jgi:hypothetical protein
MNKKLIFLEMLAGMLALGLMFISCDGEKSSFVGKWVTENGRSAPSGLPNNLELFKNGKGEIEGRSISWKVENKHLIITSSSIEIEYIYKISGNKINLTNKNERNQTYIKIK